MTERDGSSRGEAARREPVLNVIGVSVSFGGIRALDDVSLDVGAREIVGLIGPNGAGKTTLFDVISGVSVPQTGRVELGGEDTPASPRSTGPAPALSLIHI